MSDEPVTLVVLAAGASTRFPDHEIPKQFQRFALEPMLNTARPPTLRMMWENAIESIQAHVLPHLVMRRDHLKWFTAPSPRWARTELVQIDETKGQAESLTRGLFQLLSRANLSKDLLVVNCDQGFAPGLLDRLLHVGRETGDATALTFEAPPEEAKRWSYVDGHPLFMRAAEKVAIGTHALAGAYYWPNVGQLFVHLGHMVSMRKYSGEEPFLSHVYECSPLNKVSVEIRRDDWYDWGTPEALRRFTGGC